MRFCVISSGSRANCTYVESGNTRIIIDCGLSCRQFEQRMVSVGLDPKKLDGIIITHEHSDHIHGVSTLSKKYNVPVFANSATAKQIHRCFHIEKVESGNEFWIGDMRITSFSINHDAVDPVGYTIETEGVKFAQATDLGRVTPLVRESLQGSNAVVLESNHDQEMLKNCAYPWDLKRRIASSHGHLSNDTAANFLFDINHSDLGRVVLGHLSENSNTPEKALETHYAVLGEPQFSISCGNVYKPSSIFEIGWGNMEYRLMA